MTSIFRKRVLCALFLLFFCLTSCFQPCRHWELVTIEADCPPVTFAKMYLPVENTFNGLEAEFLSMGGDSHFYLSVFSLELPYANETPGYLEVDLYVEDRVYTYLAERFKGGQRLMLPKEAEELISYSLNQDLPVEVRVGRYSTTLVPDNFACSYNSLLEAISCGR